MLILEINVGVEMLREQIDYTPVLKNEQTHLICTNHFRLQYNLPILTGMLY